MPRTKAQPVFRIRTEFAAEHFLLSRQYDHDLAASKLRWKNSEIDYFEHRNEHTTLFRKYERDSDSLALRFGHVQLPF